MNKKTTIEKIKSLKGLVERTSLVKYDYDKIERQVSEITDEKELLSYYQKISKPIFDKVNKNHEYQRLCFDYGFKGIINCEKTQLAKGSYSFIVDSLKKTKKEIIDNFFDVFFVTQWDVVEKKIVNGMFTFRIV